MGSHFAFGLFDRRENIWIRAAPADVAAHELADLIIAIGVIFLQQRDCGANLAGRTITALKPVMLDKRSLHRMQLFTVGQTFNRRDLVAFVHESEREAGIYPPSVD